MFRNLIIISTVTLCTFIVAQDLKPCLITECNADPKQDAIAICNEIVNRTTDALSKVTDIICTRNFAQRKQIVDAFRTECENRSLMDEIKKLRGITIKTRSLIEFLLSNPNQIYHTIIQNIATKVWSDNKAIYYIICSLTNEEKTDLAKAFPDTREILVKYTEGNSEGKTVLVDICWCQRKEEPDPALTDERVETEVAYFKDKQEGAFQQGIKESFEKHSNSDMRRVLQKYREVYGHDIGDKIMEIMRWNIPYATLVRAIDNRQMFFAKLLHHFIKENTNCQNMMINYVLAIRTEYDLFNINEEYRTIYNADLIDDLQELFRDDSVYCEVIIKLFGSCAPN